MTPVTGPHAPASPAFVPGRRWRRATAASLLAVLTLNACYATTPIAGTPAPETRVVLGLTDRGRVAYGQQIGTGAQEIEGVLDSASDSAYVVRITAVRGVNGRIDPWNGERFAFAPDYVTNVRQRQLSKSRTTLLTVGITAAVTAAFLAAKLVGGGFGSGRDEPRPGGGEH